MNKKVVLSLKIVITMIVVAIAFFLCYCERSFLIFCGKGKIFSAIENEFSITFLDVGQGDATLIKYKELSILIDAGPRDSADKLCNDIKRVNESDNIDVFLLTHPDADHVGGGSEIFKNFNVKCCVRPKVLARIEEGNNESAYPIVDTDAYGDTIAAMYEEPGVCQYFADRGELLSEGDFKMEVLTPYADDIINASDTNAFSLVTKISYKNSTYLLMADASAKMEEKLILNDIDKISCDVLKVSHHGSKYSTSQNFLEAVKPKYAIISVGELGIKSYEHATPEFRERLENAGATILQTNSEGSITFYGDELLVETFKNFPEIPASTVIAVAGLFCLLLWGANFPAKKRNKDISTK